MTPYSDGLQAGKYFSVFQIFPTGSGSHPADYPLGTKGAFPSGRERKLTANLHVVPTLKTVELFSASHASSLRGT
jgi:hypothetical protein